MIGGLGGGLAGLGAVVGGANAGAAQAADALTRLFQAQQAQQDLQQQQQWQQYAGPIWKGLQQVTGGQQATGQDIASAASGYQPGAVQGYPLSPQVPNTSPTFPQVPNFGGAMPATSAAFGTGQTPSYVDGVGPGMKSGQMPWSQFQPIMQRRESGGQNVPNYRFDPEHTASGVNQITDTTWNRYAPKVGAPQLSYPASPMDRSVPEQNRVGEAIYNKEGPAPWANYNPALARDIQSKTQRIGQMAGSQVAQGTQDIAHTALQTIDPATYGRQQLAATMQAIEQAAPGAPGAVKFMALGMISKILQPADQMALRMQMQQNQEALRLEIQQLGFQQQDRRQAAQFEQQEKMQGSRDLEADRRQAARDEEFERRDAARFAQQDKAQAEREAASDRRTQEIIAGAGARQDKALAAKTAAVSPSEVEFLANYVKAAGTFPVGMSRNKDIQNAVYSRLAEEGVDPSKIAQTGAGFKADQSSLAAATKLSDQAIGFEETALKNLEVATKALHGVAPTNLGPMINRWIETGETGVGDPNVPASTAAVLTFANEYAKVMSGATGGAAATEGARREAFDLFNPYFSAGQWDRVAAIAKQDMANRKAALQENISTIRGRMGAGGAGPQPAAGPDYSKMTDQQLIELSRKQAQ